MKKNSLRLLSTLILVTILVSGCGLSKMVKKYSTVTYEVTPNPLEVHGDKVSVTVKGKIPAKYFNKKAAVYVQPVLKYEGGTTALKPFYLKGEKAQGDGTVINYKNGGSFTYTDVIDYKPEMNKSGLYANPIAHMSNKVPATTNSKPSDVKLLKKAVSLGDTKLADGIIYTSQRINVNGGESVVAPDGYEKETIITKKGTIYYVVNMSNLNFKLDLNKTAEAKTSLTAINELIAQGWVIKNIDINAWASPEGEENHNENLSKDRAKTANKYMEDQIDGFLKEVAKKTKTKVKDIKKATTYTINAKGEDWDGFIASLDNSDIKEKSTIVNVIKSQPDHAKKQQEIRNMTVIYKQIEDKILPPLRRAEITVNFYQPKKTDEQMALLSTKSPDSLDNKELLYAATLTKDLNTQHKIYKAATTVYPQDWKGYNNAASVDIKLGNANEASSLLEKANSLLPNNASITNNLGVVSLMKKDYKTAKSYFESAQKLGASEGYNLGIIMIKEGNYNAALSSFGSKKCDYNVALALLLSGNNTAAGAAIECAPLNAQTYYLMAIIGARTNNLNMIYDNLKKACSEDAIYKAQAKDDLEFAKYNKNSEFQNSIR